MKARVQRKREELMLLGGLVPGPDKDQTAGDGNGEGLTECLEHEG